jgi:hypothetical protein
MTAEGRAVEAPAPIYEKQVCLDLLKAKMESMDRGGTGAGFRVPQAEVCARCRAVFRELDMVQDACAQMAGGELPAALKGKILAAIREREAEEAAQSARRPRLGRRPVRAGSGGGVRRGSSRSRSA